MTNLTHDSFLCVYFNSVHFSSNLVLVIRRINCINTKSGICHSVSVTVSCAGRNLSDLHTKRSPTQSDIRVYQILYWYNWFSWWRARGCSKNVQNWNKHIEKKCASSWSFTKNHSKMHGKQKKKKNPWVYLLVKEFLHFAALELMELRSFAGYGVPKKWIFQQISANGKSDVTVILEKIMLHVYTLGKSSAWNCLRPEVTSEYSCRHNSKPTNSIIQNLCNFVRVWIFLSWHSVQLFTPDFC